jgi:endonuclease/exonuclease/phosphatase family metal-dependent hydrolase
MLISTCYKEVRDLRTSNGYIFEHVIMKRTLNANWLVLLASFWASESLLGRELRVLTYNIHHSEGRDSVFDLARIGEIVKSQKPDLVALQELDQGNSRSGTSVFQLDALAAMTGMQGYFGKTINFAGGQYGNGILVAPDIGITNIVNHPMPSPSGGEARAVIEANLFFAEGDATREFSFFATHFDHNNAANRDAQTAHVNSLVSSSKKPAILAGDLNTRTNSSTYQTIVSQWTDTTDLINSGVSRSTQIDYILNRSSDQWNVVVPGKFVVNLTTFSASDHYPLITVMRLKAPVPEPATAVLTGIIGLLWSLNLLSRCRSSNS